MRYRFTVTVVLAVSLAIILAGCHGGGATPTPAMDDVLKDALATNVGTQYGSSAADCDCTTRLMEIVQTPPTSPEALRDILREFIGYVQADPNEPACQLGLSLLMLAVAADNVGTDLGQDLFETFADPNMAAVMTLGASDKAGSLKARFDGADPSVGPAQNGDQPDFTEEEVRQAIRNELLPVLFNPAGGVYQRLSSVAKNSDSTEPLCTFGTVGGDAFTLYAADFSMMAASILGVYGSLLEGLAYYWDPGDWTMPEDPTQADTNNDGQIDPNEYLPATNFGTLDPTYGTDYMQQAYNAYVGAVDDALWATENVPADDPTDVMNMVFNQLNDFEDMIVLQVDPPETSLEGFNLILRHLEALLSGSVELTLKYYNEGETPQAMPFRMDFTQIYLNPVQDIRDLLPAFEYVIVPEQAREASQTPDWEIVPPEWSDFPDLTFNGLMPDLQTAIETLQNYQYIEIELPDGHEGLELGGPIQLPEFRAVENLTPEQWAEFTDQLEWFIMDLQFMVMGLIGG
ncbi:MAG: hypothetical protein R6V19_03670 [Armatimonadota bacterium]